MPWETIHGHRILVNDKGFGSSGVGGPESKPFAVNRSAPTNTLSAKGQRLLISKSVAGHVKEATGKDARIQHKGTFSLVEADGQGGDKIHDSLAGEGWVSMRVHKYGDSQGNTHVETHYVHPDYDKVNLTHLVTKDGQGAEKHHTVGIYNRQTYGDPAKGHFSRPASVNKTTSDRTRPNYADYGHI